MRRFGKVWLAAATLWCACGSAAGAQSLYGAGGLFLHPTAAFPEKGKVTPALLVLPQYHPVADSTRTWISGSLDYGVTPDLEVGFTALKVAGWQKDASFGGYFKYRLLREGPGRPALAVGFTGLTGGDVNTRIGFLALTKSVGRVGRLPLTGHLGVQYADVVDGLSRHQFQPYAGLTVGLSSRLSLSLEGRPRMNQEFGTPLAVTLAYEPSRDWKLAFTWANNGLSTTPRFGIGAGIIIGSRR